MFTVIFCASTIAKIVALETCTATTTPIRETSSFVIFTHDKIYNGLSGMSDVNLDW